VSEEIPAEAVNARPLHCGRCRCARKFARILLGNPGLAAPMPRIVAAKTICIVLPQLVIVAQFRHAFDQGPARAWLGANVDLHPLVCELNRLTNCSRCCDRGFRGAERDGKHIRTHDRLTYGFTTPHTE
jgi:hypothetical protein